MTFRRLSNTIKRKKLKLDIDMVRLAYDYAKDAHQGQKRASGEAYIQHPLHTANTLAEIGMDQPTIIAGLLHDVPEDTKKTLLDIRKDFGDEVAVLVEGITKLGKLKYRGIERYLENLRKMFVAMASDIRTIIVKFADRLHNLDTLDALPKRKQLRIARETLEIYAPIANRLGIGVLRTQLEDKAFKYVSPEAYNQVTEKLVNRKEGLEKALSQVRRQLKAELVKHKVKVVHCHGRTKGLYSLHKKLLRYNNDINKIYDLVAVRVVVPTISDCYTALGIVHARYKPLKERVKDYIAQPKPNHYRSLHTTIFCDLGEITEIQIRDVKMHAEDEYGIASHWQYKEAGRDSVPEKTLEWVQELAQWHKSKQQEGDYLHSLKLDVFQKRIFVFTPKGDVINLPEDSTVIDFAYHIHTEVGNKAVGATVNNDIATLSTKLRSGDMVHINISKSRKGPNHDWLKFAKTSSARSKIRQYSRPCFWSRLKPWS